MNVSRRIASTRVRLALLVGALALSSTLPFSRGAVHTAYAANDTLTIGWPISPQAFDPPGLPDNPSIWIDVNIFDQLIRPGNDGLSLKPDLATSWNITDGGKVYTFHLRPNVLFHDGTRLTSADVKFCLDRARDPNQLWSFLLTSIDHIDTPDPLTVKVTLKRPWAPFLADVALFATGIYPEAYFKKVGAKGLAAHPIGSGPYKFVSFTPGRSTVLAKNTQYWAASQFPMQQVVFSVIPSDTSRLLQVEGGQLDVDVQLASNLVAQMQSNPHAKPQIVPSTAIRYMQPNHQVAPFGDLKVRQAINAAIDREAIVKAVYSSYATPANSFLPKGMLDYDASIPTPKVDLTLARKLLSQSSVPHGFTMTYETHAGDVADNQIAVLFQQQMAPLNIKVNIKPVDPTALATANQAFKFNFIGQYWTNDIPDPDELVSYSVDYTQAVKSYYTHYNNPTLTKLSQQAATTIDPRARRQLYYRIQEIFAQQVPFFAIAYLPFINGVSTGVKGFSQNPLGYFVLQGVTKS